MREPSSMITRVAFVPFIPVISLVAFAWEFGRELRRGFRFARLAAAENWRQGWCFVRTGYLSE